MTLEALSNLAKIGKLKAEPMNHAKKLFADVDRLIGAGKDTNIG